MVRLFLFCGVLFNLLGVALGAFGAHALQAYFQEYPNLFKSYQTASQYQVTHGLALLAVAWMGTQWPSKWNQWAGILLITGVILFSGSLYILSLTGVSKLGMVTPLGGVAFLAGWACLLVQIWKIRL